MHKGLPGLLVMVIQFPTKAMVRSPGGDTDFFDIAAGVLQGDISKSK